MRPHFEVWIAAEFILDLFDYFLEQYPRAFAVVGRFDQGRTTVRRYRDLAIRPAAKLIEIVHPAGPSSLQPPGALESEDRVWTSISQSGIEIKGARFPRYHFQRR